MLPPVEITEGGMGKWPFGECNLCPGNLSVLSAVITALRLLSVSDGITFNKDPDSFAQL